ncbi:putative acyl-CoA transferase/carnitine dehydratase [Hoeflea sp. IMCC20628]|uniref:CaiB/BaiF CoA transferase family protein n=1 Tax=Hoeflea sp. IMCC20628 TaxID=1620421 RepID=UPI00063A9CB8|nr:CaiB/BaiF CoA-transferase family protein [Hoeflea sp. IMCC20628]AKI00705.1 putative acyl-CoA transferase/carnitine dehydratase [Hoeflea sp. IMCC20628]
MLEGLRIIEIEGLGPAPFACMMLADLGADVIVVHRKNGRPAPGMPERSLIDRGKRSIELDLKSADDVATLKALVRRSEALVEGFRPGVMERLGLGPDDLSAINPDLVYGRMTGWGQSGPRAQTAGHDLNYASVSGAAWYASNPGETPFTPPTLVGDIGGGALYLVAGILAGVMAARAGRGGTVVDAAIVDGSAHMMNLLMALAQTGGLSMTRGQSMLDGPHWSRCYVCADAGYISVQCFEPKFYAEFLSRLGLGDDPVFASQFDAAAWPRQTALMAGIFAKQPRAHWEALFAGSDACVAPTLNPLESALEPHMAARGVWQDVDGVLQAAPAPRFSTRQQTGLRVIPARGEHTDTVRDWLETD